MEKVKRRQSDGWSGAGAQRQRRAADGSECDCVFPAAVRDERALHGCERALVADAEPQRLLLFGIGGSLLSRSWSPRLATPALLR